MSELSRFAEIKTYRLLANKELGQHFLIDPKTAEKIVSLLETKPGDEVLEIGAGLGSLSYFLIKEPVKATLIDVDERLVAFLREKCEKYSNVEVKRLNILKTDVSVFDGIIGNLPYYLISRIIERLALYAARARKIVLMCQKEVWPKLSEKDGRRSPLSLLLNHVSTLRYEFAVGRNNFSPAPRVDSVVFSMIPNEKIADPNNVFLYETMNALFRHRRKTIANNLTEFIGSRSNALEILEKAGIIATKRPEELTIDDYLSLSRILRAADAETTM